MNNSLPFWGNLDRTGLGLTAFSTTKAPVREKQRSTASDHLKDAKAEEGNGLQPSARKRADMVGTVSLDMRSYNDGGKSAKKRNLKNWQNGPHDAEALQNGGRYINDNSMPVKEESNDSGFRRNKKPRVSQNDGKDFSGNVSIDEQKRKDMMSRPLSSADEDNTMARGLDKAKQPKKFRRKVWSPVTMQKAESLRRELGSEPSPTAATSSSSKVSDSCKTRTNYEVKGSPVESVSSSPVRMSISKKVPSMRMDSLSADDARVGDFPITRSPKKIVDGGGNYETKRSAAAKKKKASDILHPESLNYPVLGFEETLSGDKFGGKSEAGARPSPFGDGHLDDNHLDIVDGHSSCPTDLHVSETCYGKANKNHRSTASLQQISGKSSLPPKKKGRAAEVTNEGTPGRVSDLLNSQRISNPKQTWRSEADADQSYVGPSGDALHNLKHPNTGRSGLKSAKNKNVLKIDSKIWGDNTKEKQLKSGEHESRAAKIINPGSVDTTVHQSLNQGFQAEMVKNIATQGNCMGGNSQVDRHDIPTSNKLGPGTRNGDLLQMRPCDISVSVDVPKESKDLRNVIHQSESEHGNGHSAADRSAQDLTGPSIVRRDTSGQTASVVLKEAEDLRDVADRLKVI